MEFVRGGVEMRGLAGALLAGAFSLPWPIGFCVLPQVDVAHLGVYSAVAIGFCVLPQVDVAHLDVTCREPIGFCVLLQLDVAHLNVSGCTLHLYRGFFLMDV